MGIHARYYPSGDVTSAWGYHIYTHQSTGEPNDPGTNLGTEDREHLNQEYRNDKKADVIHEINQLRQENSGLALQLGVKENFSGHADILEEVNRLRLMNMRLKHLQTKQIMDDTNDAVKTIPVNQNSLTSSNYSTREHNRTQQEDLKSHRRRKHPLFKDTISTQNIFDRVDKLEINVRKIIQKYSLPKHQQRRDTEPIVHHNATSHIAVTGESFNQYAASITANRPGNTTYSSLDQEQIFEAEAKRIIAEYHKSKEQRRNEITKNRVSCSSVINQHSVQHRREGHESLMRISEGQKLDIGHHTNLTRDSQRNRTKSPIPVYCSTPKSKYSSNQESIDKYAALKPATRHGNTTYSSVDQDIIFEAEAKRIIAEYHKSKEQQRSKITKNSASCSSVTNRDSIRHRREGQESSIRHSEGQNSDIGLHSNLTMDSQRNRTKSPIPMYCSTPKPMYSSKHEQFLCNTDPRQIGNETNQDDFHSQITSDNTYRTEYTEEHTEEQRNYGDYAVRNFQHIDEPIRKPQERLHDEISRLPNSEYNDTKPSRRQMDEGCMLLIVRPTRSLSGNVVGYDVAEDVPIKCEATREEFQPMRDVRDESGDDQRHQKQELTLALDTPFKFDLPTSGGKSVAEVKYNNSLSLSMAREWRGIDENNILSDKEPDNNVTSTHNVFDGDTPSSTYGDPEVYKGDIINEEVHGIPDFYAMSTKDCDLDIVSSAEEKSPCHVHVPSKGDMDIVSVADNRPDCRTLKTAVGDVITNEDSDCRAKQVCNGHIEDVTDEETDINALWAQECNGNIESVTVHSTDYHIQAKQVCNGNIDFVTDEVTESSALAQEICDGNSESLSDEETNSSALSRKVCNGNIDRVADEETDSSALYTNNRNEKFESVANVEADRSARYTQEFNRDHESVKDETSDRQTLFRKVSDMDIVSVTDEEAACHAFTTKESNVSIVGNDGVSAEGLDKLEPINSEYDPSPQCEKADPHPVITYATKKEESVCWGTDEDEYTSGKKFAFIINGDQEASVKGTNLFPFADKKREEHFGFPMTDIHDDFLVQEVEMTQVTRFDVSESDSSCIDWSDDKKHSITTEKCAVPDCETKIKMKVERKTSYSDWDKDSDDHKGSRKDVEDILMLHEHHKRWGSISNPEINNRNPISILPSDSEHSNHEQPLEIESPQNKPPEKEDMLDAVGNLTSGTARDSDGAIAAGKSENNVTNANSAPLQGTDSMNIEQQKLHMKGTGPVEVNNGSHDSDRDSEREIAGDPEDYNANWKTHCGPKTETQVKDTAPDNAQDVDAIRADMNARALNNGLQTLEELSAGLGKGQAPPSDTDWGSDSVSSQNEKMTVVKGILMSPDDPRKQSARMVICETEKTDCPIAPFENEDTDNVPITTSHQSEECTPVVKEPTEDAKKVASSSDWDSEDSVSKKPESSTCNEKNTTLKEMILWNKIQDTSSMVTAVPVANDQELNVDKPSPAVIKYKPEYGHDPGGVMGAVTVENQDIAFGWDWDSDTDESDKNVDGTLFHDCIMNEPAISQTDTEKPTDMTKNDTSEHSNISESLSNVLVDHKTPDEKTHMEDKISNEEPQQSSDSNWDSDSEPSEDQPSVQEKSMSNVAQINLDVTDIEEKALPVVPLANVNADHDSFVNHIDGLNTDDQLSKEKPNSEEDLLDMVQKLDSDSDWDSDEESRSEEPKGKINIDIGKDSEQHAQISLHDGNDDLVPRKTEGSTLKCNELDNQNPSSASQSDHKSTEHHEIAESLPAQCPNFSGSDAADDMKGKETL